jgi:hypothetical protein
MFNFLTVSVCDCARTLCSHIIVDNNTGPHSESLPNAQLLRFSLVNVCTDHTTA